MKMAEERRRGWKERWRELGGSIAMREWMYKRSAAARRVSTNGAVEFIGGMVRDRSVNRASALRYSAISVTVDCGDDENRDNHKSPWVVIENDDSDSGGDGGRGRD